MLQLPPLEFRLFVVEQCQVGNQRVEALGAGGGHQDVCAPGMMASKSGEPADPLGRQQLGGETAPQTIDDESTGGPLT